MKTHEGDTIQAGIAGSGRSPGDEPCAARDDLDSSLDALDSQLAALLADHEGRIARNADLEEPSARLVEAVRDRLVGARECLDLLHRVWPREETQQGRHGSLLNWGDSCDDRSAGSGHSATAGDDPKPGDDLEPRKIGRFTILGELGHGGFGIVYRARDPALGREVALKLPRLETLASRDLRRRFLAEARVAARLDHPNIVPIYDVGELGEGCGTGAIYIASAYCREGPLSAWIASQGTATAPDQVVRMMIGLAEGVRHLHEQGIIHRDLKPSNVLLQRQTSGTGADLDRELVPRVTDFGLARLMEQPVEQTQSGTPIGSPPFMSPEQAQGQVRELGTATDVYGLGAILYVLLCGRPPFRGESPTETIRQVIQDEPIPPRRLRPGLPRDLETICLTCLHKEPSRRYASAAALRDDLERFLRGEPIQARPVTSAERLAKWALRHKAVSALLVALAVTMLVGSMAVVWQWRKAVGLNESLLHQVYLEKMNRAAREWDAGHVELVRELLAETRPVPREPDLRGFEWLHLDRLCRGDEVILRGHEGSVKGLAIDRGGRVLVSCAEDSTIKVWDLPECRLHRTLRPDDRNTISLALGLDGRLVIAGASDGSIRLIDLGNGQVVRRIDAHSKFVLDLATSGDGRRVVSGGADRTVRVWDLETGRQVTAASAESVVLAVAFSPDSRTFAFQNGDLIEIRDASSGALVRSLKGRRTAIRDLAFRPDGRVIAAADSTGMVTLWDTESAALIRWFHTPAGSALTTLAFSPDGRRLLSGGDEPVVTVWDVDGGRWLESYRGHSGSVTCAAFGPDGQTVISGCADNLIRVWDPSRQVRPRSLAAHSTAIKWLRYSPDGDRLLSGEQGGGLKLWEARTGRILATQPMQQDELTCLDFSPDGRTLALGRKDGVIRLWVPGRPGMTDLEGHSGAVGRAAFSADGRTLASADEGETIRVWDHTDGRLRHAFPRDPGSVVWLGFTPAGSGLVVCDADGLLTTWEWRTGRRVESRRLPLRQLRLISLDLAARRAASAGSDQSLVIWDLESATSLHAVQRQGSQIRGLALSAGAGRLLTAGYDGCVRAWDTALGKEIAFFKVSPMPLSEVALRPDGKEVAIGDRAGIVRFLAGPEVP